ncbi:NAD-dependent epimerase/dehydratase family protein [Phaeodactylibacter luteus]|uniref:NAD-dependent epimerase/dehydratase family protein n=1 Tax=Phaeodactylibacter luteus TaxID=1564516 RepID=A0A5C6RJA8_9BACT|nr:NAD-dependent epimerase/dehydratase family protein [Phaeodactylibacter luteus]TXB62203.1 NAD-dependent epimerase/dehydratase family protein [Phaeodactylibacter luteus]
MKTETILVTGANGQIGTVLTTELRARYGKDHVIATDIRKPEAPTGAFQVLDVLDREALFALMEQARPSQVYHLAAILSAKGEQDPQWAWEINMTGLFNILEAAKAFGFKVFYPSSIAVCGGETPRVNTPQHAVLQPQTVYGISKVAGEHWCNYYHKKYGVDVRSVRYPGIIGYQSLPGGGTTDYAVDIYHYAVRGEDFTCFLAADARLPMMYMADAVRATLEIMEAPPEQIRIRTSYNISGMNFTPAEVAAAIKEHVPGFKVDYAPDFRQQIAESWPESIEDEEARKDWGWSAEFDLPKMTADMLEHLRQLDYAEI